jgi:secondary thiamine-phosphate synthase enzyme
MVVQKRLTIATRGRGTYDITGEVAQAVREARIETGICLVFVHHTSASLILCENADPTVRRDLEAFLARLVPDGDPLFHHTDEGPDDMPAHVRAILTKMDLTLPVTGGRCVLGTWQGIYLYEHRTRPHRRTVTVTVLGD